jgi:DNA-binding transcriptional regulator YhcF (GntR family)
MTTRPALIVDTADPTPPYEQLRRQLAGLIRSGVLEPGGRLPPLRQLAADLGLAVGTVARAYRELESAGLVPGLSPRASVVRRGLGWPGLAWFKLSG